MTNIEKLAKEYVDPHFISETEGYGVDPDEAFKAGFNEALKVVQKNALWFPNSRSTLYLCSKIVEWLESEEDRKIELKWKEET